MVAVLLLLLTTAMVIASSAADWCRNVRPAAALLPGAPGGHPLFYSTPEIQEAIWVDNRITPQVFWNDSKVLEYWTGLGGQPPDLIQWHGAATFTPGQGLYATVDVKQHGAIRAGIDTMSDVNICLETRLRDVRDVEASVRGTGGTTAFVKQGTLPVIVEGGIVDIPALAATPDQLPSGCEAVLGMPAIDALHVDVSAQLDARSTSVPRLQCFLSEKSLRRWLDVNEGASVDTKPFDLDAVEINPDLPPPVIERIKALLLEFAEVFGSSSGNLPKPFSTKPIELNVKPDAVPKSTPEPK